MTGVDKLNLARNAVVKLYKDQGVYNQNSLQDVLEGKYDDTFVIRAIIIALGEVENGFSRAA